MGQRKFKAQESLEKYSKDFNILLQKIFNNLTHEIKDKSKLTDIINGKVLEKSDTKLNKKPEDLTEQKLIEPILTFLGFKLGKNLHRRTSSLSDIEKREADYTLLINGKKILVESEPLSKNLYSKGCGVNQVKSWLEKRSFQSDYGIATNGFEWILLKYDPKDYKTKELEKISLKPFFLNLLGRKTLEKLDKLLEEFSVTFSEKSILGSIRKKEIILEEKREKITTKFYEDYIRVVFGYDKRKKKKQYCLINNIRTPVNSSEDEKRLFSVVFMSRLIFIKFLEDKGIIEKNFFKKILSKYKNENIPISFYKAYLQPLFHDVLNTSPGKRKDSVKRMDIFSEISYLNGGLFREVIRKEIEFDVENDIVELIISGLIEKYSFTLNGEDETLNPDILGLVFEKTINYLTGEGTDRRKDLGAYYTPDDVTTYISKEVLHPYIFTKIKELLKKMGWREAEINQYESLDDMLDNLPINNPKTIKSMINLIDDIKILDPACGSGHFLTSVLKEILMIKKELHECIGLVYELWDLKKNTINKNIFGVDIEGTAVEIAKLRLWLSLIEDMKFNAEVSQIETLPNIDYNIREGNSLVGWLDEKLVQMVNVETYPERIKGIFDGLKVAYAHEKENYGKLTKAEEFLKKNNGNLVNNQRKAYYLLKKIYLEETTERAVLLREILETVRKSVYNSVNPTLLQYLRENSKKLKVENGDYKKLEPFHWKVDFGEIIDDGGFDIVIGNPPYGNLLKKHEREVLKNWNTLNCNEIACNFVEREIKLLKKDGYLSNIIAMSVFVNRRTTPTRDLIRKNFSSSKVSFFNTRPAKIFPGVEIRVSILMGKKNEPEKKGMIYTTEAIKFTKEQRPTLLESLKFESSEGLLLGKKIGIREDGEDTILPKVGKKGIRNILLKLRKISEDKIIEDLITEKGSSLEYRRTGGYWLTSLEKYPYKSTKIDKITFKDDLHRDLVLLALNSSLFYLFWSTYGNLRDLKSGNLKKFPIPSNRIDENKKKVTDLKEKLMKSLLKSFVKGKGRVGEFNVGVCKNIIDEVDDFLCPLYDLTGKETEFVKNYDSHIRKNTSNR